MGASVKWSGTLTAVSSVVHAGQTRGTVTLLRRETVMGPRGAVAVPVVSGNTWRGRLRRVGEELLRETLGYEGQIPVAAAHALRGGGALTKTSGEPLSGQRLAQVRAWVPQLGVFGAAGAGALVDSCLEVGKVVPEVAETERITGVASPLSAFEATQIESYSRTADGQAHDFAGVAPAAYDADGQVAVDEVPGQMAYRVETFPAGTRFHTWLRLRRPSELELAFFVDVLQTWSADARLGGRTGIGHGLVQADLVCDRPTTGLVDWRGYLREHRGEVMDALGLLR